MEITTIETVRRLPIYTVSTSDNIIDPFVEEEFKYYFDKKTLELLYEYGTSTYSIEQHLIGFAKYERPLIQERMNESNVRNCPYLDYAKRIVLDKLAPLRNTPLIPSNQMDSVKWIPSSAAGYGYIGKKRDNYLIARKRASQALYHFQRFQANYRFTPDMAFARCQVGALNKPKIRHVWGRAFHHILIEGLLVQNLLCKLPQVETPLYIGFNIFKDLPYKIRTLFKYPSVAYCLDFSSFDATVNNALLDIAWDILHSLLVIQDEWEENIFAYVRSLFTHTPLALPNGTLVIVHTGIPSGSLLTQLMDSIVNLLLITSAQIKYHGSYLETSVMGDDSLFIAPNRFVDLDELKNFFEPYGIILNVDKSVVTPYMSEVIFLGHNVYGSSLTREEFVICVLALHTEDGPTTPFQSLARQSSLLVDTGFNSWIIYRIFKNMFHKYNLNWDEADIKPASITFPYLKLFTLT